MVKQSTKQPQLPTTSIKNWLSIADFYLIPIFVYLEKTPQFNAVTANTPKLRVWWNEVKILASVQQICA